MRVLEYPPQMDEDGNPIMALESAAPIVLEINDIGQSSHGVIYVRDFFIDKYPATDELSGLNCVCFSATAETYEYQVFSGKIFSDHYRVSWQTDLSFAEIVEEIHELILTLKAIDLSKESEASEELTPCETTGLKIVQSSQETDLMIPFSDLEDGFWEDPSTFLKKYNTTSFVALYFITPYGEIRFEAKSSEDVGSELKYELSLISHLEKVKVLSRFIENTHRVKFDNPEGALPLLDSVLSATKATFAAYFPTSAENA